MDHVVLVIHLILTLALIALILLQRSEGGGLGLGTGGGLGNFASAQSTASALTKITTFVAIGFFATSLILAIMASRSGGEKSILDQVPNQAATQNGSASENAATPTDKGLTDDKDSDKNAAPQVPLSGTQSGDSQSGAAHDNGSEGAASSTSAQPKPDAPAPADAPSVPLTK